MKPPIDTRERRSTTTGRLLCACGKGYASEDKEGDHYNQCKLCYVRSLTCRELREKGLKRC